MSFKKGYKHTEKWKKMMSVRMKGEKNPYYGRHSLNGFKKGHLVPLEWREKLSKVALGRKQSVETIKKRVAKLKGKKRTLKHRIKYSKSKKGELNPAWKGGITPKNHCLRSSFRYKLWRKAILARDNFTCQITGKKDDRLIIHHINNFSDGRLRVVR